LPAASYSALNLLFAVTVILAGFVYRATSAPANTATPQGGTEVQYQGFVWSFLLASALTLWAVLGELVTTLLLFGEISSTSSFSQPVLWLFLALVVAAALVLLGYVWHSIKWTIDYQGNTTLHSQNSAARLGIAGATAPPGSSPPLPALPLL